MTGFGVMRTVWRPGNKVVVDVAGVIVRVKASTRQAFRFAGVVALVFALCGLLPAMAKSGSGRSGGDRWGANYFPNVPLLTHEGETVHFFDDLIEGKVVVINFIYTSCTDACPLGTARFKTVQQILGDRVGHDVFMYSISIDPERDTPERLAEYAKRHRAGPGWTFLTGKESDIELVRKKLGLYIEGLVEERDHNMSFVIGNQRTGQWMKRSPMDNPYFLADQIGTWLTNWKTPSELSKNDYAKAPLLQAPSMGENLFRTRCTICHTIGAGNLQHTVGGGEIAEMDRHRAGPDLMHVTEKRDPAWLARWLANPEQMLAAKDPIVMELYSEWGEVLMPNLRLNEVEVNALIEYLDAESRRVQQSAPVAGAPDAHSPEHHRH